MSLLDCLSAEDGMFTTESLDSRRQRLWQLQELVFEFNIDYELGWELQYLKEKFVDGGYNPTEKLPLIEDFFVNYYFDKVSKISDSLRKKTQGLQKSNKAKSNNWTYAIDDLLDDISVRRAILLSRLMFFSYKDGEAKDDMRKYHYVTSFSHSLHVATYLYVITGDKSMFISALLHDSVEDFEPLHQRYVVIRDYFRELKKQEKSDEYISRKIKEFQNGTLIIKGKENIVKEYWGIRNQAISELAEYISGGDKILKNTLILDANKFAKQPWQGVGEYHEYFLREIITNGETIENVIKDHEKRQTASRQVLIKLTDRLHNITTEFNIQNDPDKLIGRIESLNESRMMVDAAREFTFYYAQIFGISENQLQQLETYLRGSRHVLVSAKDIRGVMVPYQIDEIMRMLNSFIGGHKNKYDKKDLENFGLIYSLASTLAYACEQDIKNIKKYIPDSNIIENILFGGMDYDNKTELRAKIIKDYLEEQSSTRIRKTTFYSNIGGFNKRTNKNHNWVVGNDKNIRCSREDGFISRINQMVAKRNFKPYDSLRSIGGANRFMYDLELLEATFVMYQGREYNSISLPLHGRQDYRVTANLKSNENTLFFLGKHKNGKN